MVLDEILHKNIQLRLEFLKVPFFFLQFSYYTLMNLLMLPAVLLSAVFTLYSKCDQASDLWQRLESDLRDTVEWGKKWLVDFNAWETELILFDWSNNNGSIDEKMDGCVLEEKSCFKMLGLTFPSKLDWGSYMISIAKAASKKLEL